MSLTGPLAYPRGTCSALTFGLDDARLRVLRLEMLRAVVQNALEGRKVGYRHNDVVVVGRRRRRDLELERATVRLGLRLRRGHGS